MRCVKLKMPGSSPSAATTPTGAALHPAGGAANRHVVAARSEQTAAA
jgi:hypothetical protein